MNQKGDQRAERDFWNIGKIEGGVTVVNNEPKRGRSRTEQQLLQRVKQEVVEPWLQQLLHNAVLINLGKEAQPEQVKRPWDAEVKIGARPAEPIPEDTSILEVFDRVDLGGKLLILGNPGSGKTTTLLDLAKALIERAEVDVDFPIPVLFNLSSWKEDKQQIRDWLIAELKLKYGVRAELGERWLKNRRLLPLLDGLDEVKPERQEACVRAINAFLTGEDSPMYAVVCSRREEYNTYETSLQLNGAICLQALTLPQIQEYLVRVNRSELWDLLNRDADLLELVQAPLFLSIVILAYPQDSLNDWQQLNSREERLQDLWDRYICRMFERELRNNPYSKKVPSQKQARHWLVWLAKQMQRESQTEFLIEKLQPVNLSTEDSFMARIIILVIITLIFLMFSYGGFLNRISVALLGLVIGGSIINPMLFKASIELVETINFSGKNAVIGFRHGFAQPLPLLSLGFIGAIIGIGIDGDKMFSTRSSFGLYFGVFSVLLILTHFEKRNHSGMRKLFNNIQIPLLVIGVTIQLHYFSIETLFLIVKLWIILIAGSGMICGLVGTTLAGFRPSELESKSFPNQGIWRSVRNCIIVLTATILIAGLFSALVGLIIYPLMNFNPLQFNFKNSTTLAILGSIIGLIGGVILGLIYGGITSIQHLILRVLLSFRDHVPWNYARFLDYTSERLLIQRVGGRYRFIHKLLQDHLAKMPLD